MYKTLWLAGVALVCLPTAAMADHCPEEKVASVKPENSLAGISFKRDTIQDVLARFGMPMSHDEITPVEYPPGSGSASYTWKRNESTITISTEFYTSESRERRESMEVIELSGNASGLVPGTGHGLALGDRLERAVALYGSTYVVGTVNGPKLGERTITYCFSDETELSLGFDRLGRVVAIRLAPSIE